MEIPDATPYPWAPSERLLSLQPHKLITSKSKSTATTTGKSVNTHTHTNTSTGFSYLQHELQLNKSPSQISETAKSLLSNLLDEHNVELNNVNQDHAPPAKKQKVLSIVTEDMSEETILQMAAAGELSFFGSLLATIENDSAAGGGDGIHTHVNVSDAVTNTSTSTRTFIKTCSLAVPPASVPAAMDCKEMVMGALHFLSSVPTPTPTPTPTTPSNADDSDLLRLLPLLRPQQMTPDLEKRSYQKVRDWKLVEIESQVAALEQLFLYGSKEYAWLGRERFCPRLTTGEDLLLHKGNPPGHATGKPKKAAPVQRRKKATTTTPTPTTAEESGAAKMNDDDEAEAEIEAETAEETNLTEAMDMVSDGNASPLDPDF